VFAIASILGSRSVVAYGAAALVLAVAPWVTVPDDAAAHAPATDEDAPDGSSR